jgi:hypothetical protein
MTKQFYTEHDIEDLCHRGILSLEINDSVVLTELAYEKSQRLGMKLVRQTPDNPPCAPVRPYISQQQRPAGGEGTPAPIVSDATPAGHTAETDLPQRIREAVRSRLGAEVDSHLLDVIIGRVMKSTGVK